MNTYHLTLDVGKREVANEPVTISQGDRNATTIAATIYDDGALVTQAGLTAQLAMRLPDGTHYYRKVATWAAASGTATVTIDESEAASVPGTTRDAYFELLDGSTVVMSTTRFMVRVLRSATEGLTPGESYDGQIEELIARGEQAVSSANSAASNANSAASNANSKAGAANSAASNADQKAAAANAAAAAANSAAASANTAAGNADGKATLADQKATLATTAASNADQAAQEAREAAAAAVAVTSVYYTTETVGAHEQLTMVYELVTEE